MFFTQGESTHGLGKHSASQRWNSIPGGDGQEPVLGAGEAVMLEQGMIS